MSFFAHTAISDDDMSDGSNELDVVPRRDKKAAQFDDEEDEDEFKGVTNGAGAEEDEEAEEEGDEEEYVVEKILSHRIDENDVRNIHPWVGPTFDLRR